MSEKKELEKKLKRSEEDLEDLQIYVKEFSDFLPLPVCIVNPLGRIIDINKSAERLTGFLSIEIIGEFIKSIFLEKDEFEKIESSIEKKRFIYNKELNLITKKEKEISVNVSVSIRKDMNENYIGYFVAFLDIREIKAFQENLEEKIRKRTKELRKRIKELEDFREVTIGRELKIIDLKNKVKKLERQLKKYAHKTKN